MALEVSHDGEASVALRAHMRPDARVNLLVLAQVRPVPEASVTDGTLVDLGSAVSHDMRLEVGDGGKVSVALGAGNGRVRRVVVLLMAPQAVRVSELVLTLVTLEGQLTCNTNEIRFRSVISSR